MEYLDPSPIKCEMNRPSHSLSLPTLSTVDSPEEASHAIIGINMYDGKYTIHPRPADLLRIYRDTLEENLGGGIWTSDLRIYDLGNLISPGIEDLAIDIETINRKFSHTIPIYIGGDHLLTYATVEAHRPDTILVLDAHLDLKDTLYFDRLNRATVFRRIMERHSPKIVYWGVRGYDEEEKAYAEKRGITILDQGEHPDTHLDGKTYVSIDIDVLDPSIIRQVAYPEPLGKGVDEVLEILSKSLRNVEVIGIDIVEYYPVNIDLAEISTILKILYHAVHATTKT